jgi:hypothetical protein
MAQLFRTVDRSSDGSNRVSMEYNVLHPVPNPTSSHTPPASGRHARLLAFPSLAPSRTTAASQPPRRPQPSPALLPPPLFACPHPLPPLTKSSSLLCCPCGHGRPGTRTPSRSPQPRSLRPLLRVHCTCSWSLMTRPQGDLRRGPDLAQCPSG